MISGTTRYQPESMRGTSGSSSATPTTSRPKPSRMISLGRRSAALRPASSATANMLSDSGASDRPASIALYSSTIWR